MTKLERRHRIINSIPATILIYGFGFALLSELASERAFSIGSFLFTALLFGSTMTFFKIFIVKESKGTLPKTSEEWEFIEYIHDGTLPKDKKVHDRLIAFTKKYEDVQSKNLKSAPIFVCVGIVAVAFGFIVNELVFIVIGILLGVLFLVMTIKSKKWIKNAQDLLVILEKH